MKRVLKAALTLALLPIMGCEPDDPDDVACTTQAPYRLLVSAVDESLPPSTVVRVRTGGGEVEYSLAAPPDDSELLFCEADATGAVVHRLSCDVWTQGAADVEIEATGYHPILEQLSLDKVDGCVVTQEVLLELVPSEK